MEEKKCKSKRGRIREEEEFTTENTEGRPQKSRRVRRQDAGYVPRSLRYATRCGKQRRGGNSRVAPVGMTISREF